MSSINVQAAKFEYLEAPTQIKQCGVFYVISDTFNNRVLYSTNMYAPISEWCELPDPDGKLKEPHAVATDNTTLAVTCTASDTVTFYKQTASGYEYLGYVEVTERPHYIEYDSELGKYLVWCSSRGHMYYLTCSADGEVDIDKHVRANFLKCANGEDGVSYCRSFTIDGSYLWMPSLHQCTLYKVNKRTLDVVETYSLPQEYAGVDMLRHLSDGKFYMTVHTDSTGRVNYKLVMIENEQYMKDITNWKDISHYLGDYNQFYYMELTREGTAFLSPAKVNSQSVICTFNPVTRKCDVITG